MRQFTIEYSTDGGLTWAAWWDQWATSAREAIRLQRLSLPSWWRDGWRLRAIATTKNGRLAQDSR